jgi:hypothetical protein
MKRRKNDGQKRKPLSPQNSRRIGADESGAMGLGVPVVVQLRLTRGKFEAGL